MHYNPSEPRNAAGRWTKFLTKTRTPNLVPPGSNRDMAVRTVALGTAVALLHPYVATAYAAVSGTQFAYHYAKRLAAEKRAKESNQLAKLAARKTTLAYESLGHAHKLAQARRELESVEHDSKKLQEAQERRSRRRWGF